jgi:hypothetical protein
VLTLAHSANILATWTECQMVFKKGWYMKSLLFLVLTAGIAITSRAADDTPFSGKWQVNTDIADRSLEQVCTFTQTGNELTGSCTSQSGMVTVTGKIDQKKITWQYKMQSSEAGTVTLIHIGTLSSTNGAPVIVGTVNVEEYGVQGSFSANPAK